VEGEDKDGGEQSSGRRTGESLYSSSFPERRGGGRDDDRSIIHDRLIQVIFEKKSRELGGKGNSL